MVFETGYNFARYAALLASLMFDYGKKDESAHPMQTMHTYAAPFLRQPSTFEELTAADGKPLLEEWTIADLKERGISLEDILALMELGIEEGEPVFSRGAEISLFTRKGTVDDAEAFYAIRDEEGNHLVDSGSDMEFFLGEGTYPEDVRKLPIIKDKEGKSIFKSAYELLEFQKAGGTEEYAQQLAELKDDQGRPLFAGFDIIEFLRIGGTREYVTALRHIPVKKGGMSFHGGLIFLFKKAKGTIEEARQLSQITDQSGDPIFDAASMWMFRNGASAFAYSPRDGSDIDKYLRTMRHRPRGTVAYARELAGIKDREGNPKYDGFGMYRLLQLGLKGKDLVFRDTPKPNAVIVYPTVDFFGVFEVEESLAFFHKIRKAYDLSVAVASREEQVYQAVHDVPNIRLLILGGHGGPTTLSLGTKDPRDLDFTPQDTYTIDTTDSEFQDHLNRLASTAVIFLYSCENAKGEKGAENLATFISRQAGNRCVFAAKETFPVYGVTVKTMIPFSVEIRDDNGRDITYANEHCNQN